MSQLDGKYSGFFDLFTKSRQTISHTCSSLHRCVRTDGKEIEVEGGEVEGGGQMERRWR